MRSIDRPPFPSESEWKKTMLGGLLLTAIISAVVFVVLPLAVVIGFYVARWVFMTWTFFFKFFGIEL